MRFLKLVVFENNTYNFLFVNQSIFLNLWVEDEVLESITNSMGMGLSKLQEIVKEGKPGMLQSM